MQCMHLSSSYLLRHAKVVLFIFFSSNQINWNQDTFSVHMQHCPKWILDNSELQQTYYSQENNLPHASTYYCIENQYFRWNFYLIMQTSQDANCIIGLESADIETAWHDSSVSLQPGLQTVCVCVWGGGGDLVERWYRMRGPDWVPFRPLSSQWPLFIWKLVSKGFTLKAVFLQNTYFRWFCKNTTYIL